MHQEKAHLRRVLKRVRGMMPDPARAEADALMAQAVVSLPEYAACRALFAYCPHGPEADAWRIAQCALAEGKQVALPRVTGPGTMVWHRVTGLGGLVESAWGILEPAAQDDEVHLEEVADLHPLALVPGLGYDSRGFRLGHGGGFYDRFLPAFQAAGGVAVGLCWDGCFLPDMLPHEAHDVPVDVVITEAGERFRRIP